jgi:thiol:disulfide interchange protein DsbC
MIKRKLLALLTMSIVTAPHAVAGNEPFDTKQAEEQLKATYSNFSFSAIEESPINGFVEVHTANGIVYFSSEQKLMIFGKVFNHVGENLTEKSMQKSISRLIPELPIDTALTLGDEDADIEIIEFTNPDCGYCQRFEQWLPSIESAYNIKRKIFLMDNQNMPQGRDKFAHIICSDDKEKAHSEVYGGQVTKLKTCAKSDEIIKQHQVAVKKLGIQGTPSFVINGQLITGFNKKAISDALITISTSK